MNPDPEAFDGERELDDPALEAVADAILEGTPVDWIAAKSGGSADPSLERQLRVLSDMVAVHRTLFAGEPTIASEDATASIDTHPSWGHLRLLEKVGQGAFGEVFRAWDPHLNREVALKLLGPSGPSPGNDSPSWILEEARFLAAVRHPNVVTVYGADRIDGRVGFWTEFIHGRTLAELVHTQGRFSAADAVAIGIDACRAISAVHRAGLLHRDIKANNVMREDGGRIVLLDFGATKDFVQCAVPDAVIGDPNGPTGTPLYVAPELWRDSAATPQSDLYSLGVLLYFLVTGSYPVRGATVRDLGDAHRAGTRVSLRDERPDLADAFLDIVERAIDPDPSERFKSIDAVAAELSRVDAAMTALRPGDRWKNRHVFVSAIAALGLVSYAAFLAWQPQGVGPGRQVESVREPEPPATGGSETVSPATPPSAALTPSIAPALRTPPPATTPEATPAIRKVDIPDFTMGHPSRNGRFLPYVGKDGNIQILDVATGKSHPATYDASSDEKGADWFMFMKLDGSRSPANTWSPIIMSPTGDRVAYTWAIGDDTYELRLAGADGKWHQTLLERRSAYEPVPVDWSHDGRDILCWLLQKDGTADLILISTDGGSRRVVYHKETPGWPPTAISPDGRFVVFSRQVSDTLLELMMASIDGGEPRPLFAKQSFGMSPGWVDNTHVFFLRPTPGAAGLRDGWIAEVVNGVIEGEPSRAIANSGAPRYASIAGDGLVYFNVQTVSLEVYRASIDVSGTAPPGAPLRISQKEIDRHLAPSWSPNGKSIAYLAGRPSVTPGLKDSNELRVKDVSSGAERTLQPKLAALLGYRPQWTSGGKYLMVYGADEERNERVGYYRVDVQTSETSAVMIGVTPLSRVLQDGTGLLYLDGKRGIVEHKFAGDDDSVVVPVSGWSALGGFGLSPDERMLAFAATVTDGTGKADVLEVQTRDGAPRELQRVPRPERLRFQSWTPDGHHLLYTRGSTAPFRLWMMSASGDGEPRDMQLALPDEPNPLTVSPDGRYIAYPERIQGRELWIQPLPRMTSKKR